MVYVAIDAFFNTKPAITWYLTVFAHLPKPTTSRSIAPSTEHSMLMFIPYAIVMFVCSGFP